MNITVYSTKTCPWCIRVKDYLNQMNKPFTDVDVSEDRSGAMEMIRKSGQRGVPVIDIDGTIIIGFDKAKLDTLLK